MDECFPRGGTLKKSEETSIKKRPREDDNLFSIYHEDAEDESIKKKKKKKEIRETLQPEQHERGSFATVKAVELLKYKDLNVGMLFLGCIKEVKDFELVISLPYNLIGFVQATNICEAYTKMLNKQVEKEEPLEGLMPLSNLYSPGMLVRCAISNLETTSGGFNSIKLSLNPKHINGDLAPYSLHKDMHLSGLVSSVEDHGYLIDLGIGGTKAFLPRQKAEVYVNQANKGTALRVGQYLDCIIEEVKNDGRILRLSVSPSEVAAAVATDEQNWTLNNLLPGLVVKAQIQKISKDHITVSFLSSYTGVVDFLHLESRNPNVYQIDQIVKACILWIDKSSKTIRLTLRKTFLQPGKRMKQLSSDWIGTVHEKCTVKALYKSAGAMFQLDEETTAFAHKYHLILKDSTHLNAYKQGTVHTGRVVGFSPIDEILLLSLKEIVIEEPFWNHEDIQAGQLLEGTVNKIETQGITVNLTNRISGLVPNLHMADVTLRHPEKRYTPGKKIKCRVLNVDTSAKKLILTRKKTMITSKFPIIASFHDAKPGLITHGFIWAVKDYGCIVKFYNNVHGLAPTRELSSQFIPTIQEAFYKGQVIKVRVLECNPEKETLLLSFKIFEENDNEEQGHSTRRRNPHWQEPGKIVDVRISSKTDTELNVLILPEESPAVLPKVHLSDHVTNCELLFHCLKEGDELNQAMCINNSKGQTILTRKPALISCVEKGSYAKDFSEVQVGMFLTGFVRNVMSYGVFVEFLRGLVGLVPISEVSDKFVTEIRDHFVEGQTVVAKVTNIDEEKKRFLLTLKMSECAPDDCTAESLSHISHCFDELQFSKDLMKGNEDEGASIFSLVPEKLLILVVEKLEDNGLVLFSAGKVPGAQIISAVQCKDKEKPLSEGQKVKAVVLHIDILKAHVYVSMEEALVKKCKKNFAENSVHSAFVQHVAEEFAIASLEGTSKLVAVPLNRHFNDTLWFKVDKLSLGEKISVTLLSVDARKHGLLLAVQNICSGRQKGKFPQDFAKRQPSIGEVITGTVKSVKPTSVLVSITDNLSGTIHASQIAKDVPVGSLPTSKLRPKQNVTCRVIGGRDIKTHKFLPITHPHLTKSILELSVLPSLLNTKIKVKKPKPLKSYSSGDVVTCYVAKYHKEKQCLEVELSPGIRGKIEQLLLSSSLKVLKRPEKHFRQGQAVSATVVEVNDSTKQLSLSLTNIHVLTEGCITIGCVKSLIPGSGLQITLPFGKTGRASLFQLNDRYDEISLEKFTPGMFVRCCILSVGNKIDVSLRESRTNPGCVIKCIDEDISSIDCVKEGQLVNGFVSAVTDKGVFFRISSSLDGHILFKNFTSYYVQDIKLYKKHIPEGKLLTAKILSINKEDSHIELSLLPNDTGNPDIIPESAGFSFRWKKGEKKRGRTDSESQTKSSKKKKSRKSQDDEDSGVEVNFETNDKKVDSSKQPAPRLQVSSDFSWDVSLNTLKTSLTDRKESSSDSEEDEEKEPPKAQKTKSNQKKQGSEKKSAGKEATEAGQRPQSVNEFERLVLSAPNISSNWIDYMEFHLQATELEQARAVAERALQTIYFREEQEKLNVWVAMLSVENIYGTEETLLKVFERAVQYNDPLKAFQNLVDIYIKSEKFKEADDLFNTMIKRFKQEKSVYWKYATFLLKQGQSEAAHRLLQRALKCLPEKEHVDVISKFAQLEFNLGDPVRAKALFESTLSSYPKRTDIWSVYIDMMVKHGSQKEIRDIFERVIHLSLAAKRIKFFFKRYLEYEKKYGNEQTVQTVKEKALKYVESKSSVGTS